MRYIARKDRRDYGTAATKVPERASPGGLHDPQAGCPGPGLKVELASVFPGGVTRAEGSRYSRVLQAGSPEPVIGYGRTRGIRAKYRTVILLEQFLKIR